MRGGRGGGCAGTQSSQQRQGYASPWACNSISSSCHRTIANTGNLGPKLEPLRSITIKSHVRDGAAWAPRHSSGTIQYPCPSPSQPPGTPGLMVHGAIPPLCPQAAGLAGDRPGGAIFKALDSFGPFPLPGAQVGQPPPWLGHVLLCSLRHSIGVAGAGHGEGSPRLSSQAKILRS